MLTWVHHGGGPETGGGEGAGERGLGGGGRALDPSNTEAGIKENHPQIGMSQLF